MPVWNPDLPDPIDYQAQWSDVPDNMTFDNGFKVEWELFLTCAADGRPFAWDLVEGAKGVQLANLALRSSAEGRRLVSPRGLGRQGFDDAPTIGGVSVAVTESPPGEGSGQLAPSASRSGRNI